MEYRASNRRVGTISPHGGTHLAEAKARRRATIYFEVAPDPDNQALISRWRKLPEGLKPEITRRVALAIVPKVLAAFNV